MALAYLIALAGLAAVSVVALAAVAWLSWRESREQREWDRDEAPFQPEQADGLERWIHELRNGKNL